ncbi:MAG: Acetyl-CoA synthetase II (ACSII, ADP-forming), subunit alpha [Candidatus Bathyarchaeota archaeon BA2]|nr:MAG: Acetyl-CoA synthetase II (ACSII, ADP-forming), subunit alpha [Candidatus Bathyarchaeota archaeon BA2]
MVKAVPQLEYLFNPSSIALVGASRQPIKWGSIVLGNIIKGGYKGKVYPINPKAEKIQDLKCYPNVKKIPAEVDLSIIAAPAVDVRISEIIEDCAEKNVKAAIVISSGFGETGEKGKRAEEELVSSARKANIRFVGPNSMGIFSASANLHALMPTVRPLKGDVSFVSQSGNLGVQTLDRGVQLGVGFNLFVSSGNEADLHCEDYINYFRQDPETKIILSYIEGLKDGVGFMDVARETTKKKPIIAFKAGETEAGASAALSHTGSLTGSSRIYDSVFKQVGVIKAENTEDMLDFALAFKQPLPKGRKVAILTRGGGWGVVTADACDKAGIELPKIPKEIFEELDKVLPLYWSKNNPIDSVALINPYAHIDILKIIKKWKDVDGLIILGGLDEFYSSFLTKIGVDDSIVKLQEELLEEYIKEMIEIAEDWGKPVFAVVVTLLDKSRGVQLLNEHNIPVYYSPERAVKAFSKLIEWKEYLKKFQNSSDKIF